MLSPFIPQTRWAIKTYQEESIVPQYLRQADLKKMGLGTNGAKFFNGSDSPTDSDLGSPMLTMRNFIIADKVGFGAGKFEL